MVAKLRSAINGTVRIRVSGNGMERFLNLCNARGIYPKKLVYAEHACCLTLRLQDYWQIKPLVKKAGVSVRLEERIGLPFFLHRYRKRKMLFLGILFTCCFLYIMSLFVWNIQVTGNLYYSEETILSFLKSQGYVHGIWMKSIVCDDIEALIRNQFNDITWVSVQISGTCLNVAIKENHGVMTLPEKNTDTCDLVSDSDGTVISIITRSGTPLVKAGDTVKEGDILVSGIIEIHDDAKEVVTTHDTYADADVIVETIVSYEKEISRCYTEKNYIAQKSGFFFQVLDAKNTFSLPGNPDALVEATSQITQLKLFTNYYLPVYFGRVTWDFYENQEKFYEEEEFLAYCDGIFLQDLENLEKKGVQIIENNVTIQVDDFYAKLTGTLTLQKNAGVRAEITRVEEEENGDYTDGN